MISVSGILWGLSLVVSGVLFVRFSYQIAGFTGRQDWIESKLGSGTTYGAYKMFGVLLVFVGIFSVTGLWPSIAAWLLTPLRGLFGHP